MLRDVEVATSRCELSPSQQANLHEIARGCQNALRKLEETLDQYSELETRGGTLRQQGKRIWKRFRWDPLQIAELRSRITSNISLLHAFVDGLSR